MRSLAVPSKVVGFALAVASLSACGPSIIHDSGSSLFSPVEYSTQASRGDVPVTVFGSVAGLDGARLSDTVVAHMQGADWPPHARFAPASSVSDQGTYSYVMSFNGPRDVTSATLCARRRSTLTEVPSAAKTDGDVVLVAGLCRYDKVASGVTARTAGVSGPSDPKLRELIASTVQELTRVQGRQHNNSSDGKDKS
jgi:hypothetical protein